MTYQNDFLAFKPTENLLKGRVIVITGAGDGIGKAIAIACAEAGATVVLLGRTIFPINFESATKQDFQQLKDALTEEFGLLDGLLHNAAVLGTNAPAEQYSASDWQTIMQVNVTAPFMLTQSLLPLLKKSKDASVVFTGSGVGYRGRAYWGAYAASKAAAENVMQTLADEYSEHADLRFNSINPGATRTQMRAKAYPAESPDAVMAPSEHANRYLYLLGPASRGISGEQFQAQP